MVTIWEGFKAWFVEHGLPFDYVLYSNYERMVEDLVDGRLDVAWNSPLAWVRAQRLAASRGATVRAVVDARHRPRPHVASSSFRRPAR